MRHNIIMIFVMLITTLIFAQQGISYKAIIKDDLGNVLTNENITIQFRILDALSGGNIEYQGTHYDVTTNANGIAIVNIGEGEQSLSYGAFDEIDWQNHEYFLQTRIDITGGANFEDMGTSQFMAVPYAKHAKTADNIFSGDYNDLTNQPDLTITTGLKRITQDDGVQNNSGWRIQSGANQNYYGPIGENAIDLSFRFVNDNGGATGIQSFAQGYGSSASGDFSVSIGGSAIGHGSIALKGQASGYGSKALGGFASGIFSTSMGSAKAESYRSIAIGRGNIGGGYPGDPDNPSDIDNWVFTDPLFEVGNGYQNDNGGGSFNFVESNALTILKNAKTGINTANPASMFEVVHGNTDPTALDRTDALSITNNVLNQSWQFHVGNANGSLILFRNGLYRGYFDYSSGAYIQASDSRVKKDIKPINSTLNKVMQLNPVSYLMKEQRDTKRNLGLISQEVQKIFPSITHYVKESDILALSYTELIPILVKALQEQQAIIEVQNSKIEAQHSENTQQNEAIQSLLQRMNALEVANN